MAKQVEIYTDGACSGNPGPGGWGAILRYKGIEKELSGGERETTNNRMELTAVIEALKALRESCTVTLCTDSKYVAEAFNQGWIYGWMKKNWKKSDGKPVANVDLWVSLMEQWKRHDVTIVWVKGHAENVYNNRCDELAVAQSKRMA